MPDRSRSRRSSRYLVDLPVFCRDRPRGSQVPRHGSGWTRNLSVAGACLELREAFAPGTALSLVLQTEGESLTLEAVGCAAVCNTLARLALVLQ